MLSYNMKMLIILVIMTSALFGLSYDGPEVVVELSPDQVGLKEEDVAIGPYRLIARDSTLYLLDQLNKRILCYDTSGSYIQKIGVSFRPADMAVDSSGRIYLLENRTKPVQVVVLRQGKEIERIKIKYEVNKSVTAIAVNRYNQLVVLSGRNAYRPLKQEGSDIRHLNWMGQVVGRYHFDIEQFLPTVKAFDWFFAAKDTSGILIEFELACSGRDHLTFLGDDTHGRIYVGMESVIQDKSGSFYILSLKVYERTREVAALRVKNSYHSYDLRWRNFSVDAAGNIYMFKTTEEGESYIERWRVSP